jgi:hypothetical protein
MKPISRFLALSLLLLASTGCLIKETTHTFYLDPDGAIVWRVVEKDVRSDAEDVNERHKEEANYLDAVRAGESRMAVDFDALGALRVDTRVISDRRPYFVVTEATFGSIEELALAILEETCSAGSAELVFDGDRARFTIRCPLDAQQAASDETREEDFSGVGLIEESEAYRVVLTEGKFVDAIGFDLDPQDTARPRDLTEEELEANNNVAVYSLTWCSQ